LPPRRTGKGISLAELLAWVLMGPAALTLGLFAASMLVAVWSQVLN
jgi:hypothetical protein